jgi:hypothetical protein
VGELEEATADELIRLAPEGGGERRVDLEDHSTVARERQPHGTQSEDRREPVARRSLPAHAAQRTAYRTITYRCRDGKPVRLQG